MQRFPSAGSAQRFLSAHASVYNTFNICRHLITSATKRCFRTEASSYGEPRRALLPEVTHIRNRLDQAQQRDKHVALIDRALRHPCVGEGAFLFGPLRCEHIVSIYHIIAIADLLNDVTMFAPFAPYAAVANVG